MSEIDDLEAAIRAQFVADVVEWLEWLDDEYDDVDVPADDATAEAVVDLTCDPRLVVALGDMPEDDAEELRDAYRESEFLRLMVGRNSLAMRGEAFAHPLVPPEGAPEGMHR